MRADHQELKDTSSSTLSSATRKQSIGDMGFKGIGNLIRLLPTGTIFLFEFRNPLLTDEDHCTTIGKYLSGILMVLFGFFCCFSFFTDGYVGSDGRVCYGLVTTKGLWPFYDPQTRMKDLSRYKLRIGDFVHALLSLIVFATIALLDSDTIACFYPHFGPNQKVLLMSLPLLIGFVSSFVFMAFPNIRHGIGHPAMQTSQTSA